MFHGIYPPRIVLEFLSARRENLVVMQLETLWREQRLTTLKAKMHGNEPSRGAKIDAQIQAEEEEELRRKGKA